jgi:hypothetical protein
MSSVGVFLKPGGNKVFFVNGVLKVFEQENITVDHLIGYSSSSAILFAHLFSCHDHVTDLFGKRLKENKRNFYLFKKERFPHNDIYKGVVRDVVSFKGSHREDQPSFSVIATQTSKRSMKIKGLAATISLACEEFGIRALPIFQKVCGISVLYYDSRSSKKLSDDELVDLIIGSSTIYPFIKLHTLGDVLILDGALITVDPIECLSEFSKKIIIHTKKGKTCVTDDVLHIYSSQSVPNNILDYTDDSKIKVLQKNGEKDAKNHIQLIRNYVQGK